MGGSLCADCARAGFCHESSLRPISTMPRAGQRGMVRPGARRPPLTARRAAPSDEYAQAGSRRVVFLSVSLVPALGCRRFKNETASTEIYSLALHDALPI